MSKPTTKQTHQELKDKLWRLDESVSVRAAQLAERTGRAWKAAVEFENWQRELVEARNLARETLERIQATIDDTIKDLPME